MTISNMLQRPSTNVVAIYLYQHMDTNIEWIHLHYIIIVYSTHTYKLPNSYYDKHSPKWSLFSQLITRTLCRKTILNNAHAFWGTSSARAANGNLQEMYEFQWSIVEKRDKHKPFLSIHLEELLKTREAEKSYLATRSGLYEVHWIQATSQWRRFHGELFLRVLRSFRQQFLGKVLFLFLSSCTGSSVVQCIGWVCVFFFFWLGARRDYMDLQEAGNNCYTILRFITTYLNYWWIIELECSTSNIIKFRYVLVRGPSSVENWTPN